LGSYAGSAGQEMVFPDFGDEFLERLGEEPTAEGTDAFVPDEGGVAEQEIPESGIGENLGHVLEAELGFAVGFAGEGEDGIGAGFGTAVDKTGKMDSEKGK